ncbi:initiation factor 2 beta-like protein [Apiospora arundinis]
MAFSSSKPTFVLISGGWHRADYWSEVAADLRVEGHGVIPLALPSASSDPDVTFLDDLTSVRDVIRKETEHGGRDVVIATHSLGTVVGASAIKGFTAAAAADADKAKGMLTPPPEGDSDNDSEIDEDVHQSTATAPATVPDELSMQDEHEPPRRGHVIGFVTVATGFVPTGACFLAALGGTPPPLWRYVSEPRVLTTDEDDLADDGSDTTTRAFCAVRVSAREAFYGDLPVEEGERWVARLLPQGSKAVAEGGEHVYAGWLDVPCWSLVATEDRAFPYEGQKASIQAARDAGADIWSEEIAASHSPMLSRPAETADFLRRAAVAFEEKASSPWRK